MHTHAPLRGEIAALCALQVGGGGGLDLGKARVKAMVESFGGKVTSSVSGRTDVLIVGKDPGASKVGAARSMARCVLMSLRDVRQGLVQGSLEAVSNGKAPLVIENFSAGYRGNGIGHAIKAPAQPKPPAAAPKPTAKAAPPKPDPPPSAKAAPAPISPGDDDEEAGTDEKPLAKKAPPRASKPAKAKAAASKAKPKAKPDKVSHPANRIDPKRTRRAQPAACSRAQTTMRPNVRSRYPVRRRLQ